ncbi:MAG: hypothetical protein U0P48_00300 [Ancrocorticia sp.]
MEQVALRAGIDRNHYQLMESARSDRKSNKAVNPQMFTLLKLATALESSLRIFLKVFLRFISVSPLTRDDGEAASVADYFR